MEVREVSSYFHTASVVAYFIAAAFWYLASKAKVAKRNGEEFSKFNESFVLEDEMMTTDKKFPGLFIWLHATANKQSWFNARAAEVTAAGIILQLISDWLLP